MSIKIQFNAELFLNPNAEEVILALSAVDGLDVIRIQKWQARKLITRTVLRSEQYELRQNDATKIIWFLASNFALFSFKRGKKSKREWILITSQNPEEFTSLLSGKEVM